MSTLAIKRARLRDMRRPAPRNSAAQTPPLFGGGGGEQTLDQLLTSAWEELTAHTATACPVCGGRMAPEYGATDPGEPEHPGARETAGGRCQSCGTTLS